MQSGVNEIAACLVFGAGIVKFVVIIDLNEYLSTVPRNEEDVSEISKSNFKHNLFR